MRKLSTEEINRPDLKSHLAAPKKSLVFILDNIRSGLNVGSAFRTADAMSVQQIYLCGITAQPPQRDILKSAIGATESVSWQYEQSAVETVSKLSTDGWKIIGVEQTTESVPLIDFDIRPNEKYALVFGNEVRGISSEVLPLIDNAIEVKQFGIKHSLNVSVCIGIVSWRFANSLSDPF